MATVWRLTPPAYARLLDGEGSRLAGGRWNSPGCPLVYTSTHLSLSVLEVLVHFPPELRDNLPELEATQLSVPDNAGATEIPLDQFRGLLADGQPLSTCRAFGDEWVARGSALVLKAPSVLVPEELNVMINPAHSGMREVTIVSSRRFHFDPRFTRPA
jgi:RES domain-containing protein